jgi:hypothetical protein
LSVAAGANFFLNVAENDDINLRGEFITFTQAVSSLHEEMVEINNFRSLVCCCRTYATGWWSLCEFSRRSNPAIWPDVRKDFLSIE